MGRRSAFFVLALLSAPLPVRADAPLPTAADLPAVEEVQDEWPLESLTLRDGVVYQGLILAVNDQEVEFGEIVRPRGRPMFCVIRPVEPEQIASMVRLPPPERQKLLALFQQFRTRARIEAGRMQDVALRREPVGGQHRWTFEGPWFRLESTTDEEMTRRAVVRTEQIFRAYRQVLRPAQTSPRQLRVLLFGDRDQYRRFVDSAGFQITNPAFYAPATNLIVAGSDLNAYAQRLAQVRTQHAEVRRQYKLLDSTFAARLAGVLEQMQQSGYETAEIEQEARLRRSVWRRELETALARVDAADRQNETRFAEVTQEMFARLYHEAFHAYVDNYVYPESTRKMPRWLDEGLAQIFETSQLDADTLRIDAPDPERLRALQQDLAGAGRLGIADLLSAADDEFLDAHGVGSARRLYVYAWGLAYYLTYERNLLHGQQLAEYVANPHALGPTARFTRLSGIPLAQFESAWRTAMLDLKPR